MQTFFLKFADEADALAKLADYRTTNEAREEVWMQAGVDFALDVLGVIHQPTGETLTDGDGINYPEMAPIDGFHVNLATERLPEALEPFEVTPDRPIRVFA